MKLYFSETINPRKACAVARHLNAPVEYVHVDLSKGEHRQPEFLAINPNGKVPVLQDGDRIMWELNAIMAYIAERAGSDLWPKDDRQMDVLRWLSWDAQHFTRYAGVLYFQYLIRPYLNLGEPNADAVSEATGFFKTYANVLNDHLRGRKFLVSDKLSIADFAVGVTLPLAAQIHLPLDSFPEIRRWSERLNELPAWREPFPARAIAA